MSLLQRLLLLPLLSPLLAVLLLGAINPRPWVALRLLTWTSPALPLGAWISAAAAAGAGLSATGALLALRGGASAPLPGRRQVRRRAEAEPDGAPWPAEARNPATGRSPSEPRDQGGGWAGPTRAAAEPPPTVSVPFRVIRRGSDGGTDVGADVGAGSGTDGGAGMGEGPGRRRRAAATPASTATTWAGGAAMATAAGDGWDAPVSEEW
ncbi:MAG: hypothetical protein RLZZ219_1567 [Cyanobacteriota bacterium]